MPGGMGRGLSSDDIFLRLADGKAGSSSPAATLGVDWVQNQLECLLWDLRRMEAGSGTSVTMFGGALHAIHNSLGYLRVLKG